MQFTTTFERATYFADDILDLHLSARCMRGRDAERVGLESRYDKLRFFWLCKDAIIAFVVERERLVRTAITNVRKTFLLFSMYVILLIADLERLLTDTRTSQ